MGHGNVCTSLCFAGDCLQFFFLFPFILSLIRSASLPPILSTPFSFPFCLPPSYSFYPLLISLPPSPPHPHTYLLSPFSLFIPPSLPPSLPPPTFAPLPPQSSPPFLTTTSSRCGSSLVRQSTLSLHRGPSRTAWRNSTKPWRTCAHTKWRPASTTT